MIRTGYSSLEELIQLIDLPNRARVQEVMLTYDNPMRRAKGSSRNHQAWEGGYLHHIAETMNIAVWLYVSSPRQMPFTVSDALVVMFLHDLEKPWKYAVDSETRQRMVEQGYDLSSKTGRKVFREKMIDHSNIELTDEQRNALRYVEGIPDSEYTPGERIMGPLAAFCHCCDIMSARLWHDKGSEGVW